MKILWSNEKAQEIYPSSEKALELNGQAVLRMLVAWFGCSFEPWILSIFSENSVITF